ncbi:MAG: energy transducer TonB [Maricaulaceae bacterium]
MKHYLKLLAASLIVGTACSTTPNNEALREAHFKSASKLNARLNADLLTREQAVCEDDLLNKASSLTPIATSNVTDRDAVPLVRIPPIMPPAANKSGACKLLFDVNAKGQTTNIQIISCTDDLYSYASRKSLSRWQYNPKIKNGVPVSRCDVETKITFRLIDKDGNII